jgi:hypothetical protein
MLKPKSSQNRGSTHIYHTSQKSLNKCCLLSRELMASVFWDRKGVLMVEFMQQGTKIPSEGCNADIQCNAPPWKCVPSYCCSHLSIAGAFQLRVVSPPPLKPWSCSDWLELIYTYIWRTGWDYSTSKVISTWWNVSKYSSLWHRHPKTQSVTCQEPQFWRWLYWEVT